MKKISFVIACVFPALAMAQSTGIPWKNGRVLTAPMMQSLDDAKMNVQSLGKPGFAPQLNALGQITNPVVGDVSQAKATTDGQTVVQVTAKAANAVQQNTANEPNGYVKPDANGTVALPVTGNVAAAPAAATGTTTARTLANRFADTVNLADLGATLDGSSADQARIQTIYDSLPDGTAVYVPAWSKWTGTITSPNPSKHLTWVLDGNLPGAYTPPPGDGDTTVFMGGAALHAQKRDINTTSFGYPGYFTYWNDDSNYTGMWGGNFQQYSALKLSAISGPSSKGHTSPVDINIDSYGQNPSDSYDIAINSYITKFGQNSAWGLLDNITDRSGRVPGFAAGWNEFDMWMNGYDIKPWDPSYGSPQAGHRSAFFVAGAHNSSAVAWAANQQIDNPTNAKGSLPKPHLLDVTGSDGIHYIWYQVQGGTTGSTQPTFPLSTQFVGTLSKGILTVTSMNRGAIAVGDYLIGEIPIHPPQITAQLSGTTGGIGTYSVADTSSTIQTPVALSSAPHVTDGTVIWEYGEELNSSISSLLFFTGSPGDSVDTMVGAKEGIILGNAAVDTSLMTFQKNSAAIRMASGQPIDFSSNGTLSGANLHTLDYEDGNLDYKVGGSVKLQIPDNGPVSMQSFRFLADQTALINSTKDMVLSHDPTDGTTANAQISLRFSSPQTHLWIDSVDFGAIRASQNLTKTQILAITNATEGLTEYDTDDHTEVQYRCPTTTTCGWFPVQYGTALSN